MLSGVSVFKEVVLYIMEDIHVVDKVGSGEL